MPTPTSHIVNPETHNINVNRVIIGETNIQLGYMDVLG
jgi:hypothetical protein